MSFGPDYEKWHSCRDLHPVCQIESLVSYYIEDRSLIQKIGGPGRTCTRIRPLRRRLLL